MICESKLDEEDLYNSTFYVSFSVQDFRDLSSLDRYTRTSVVEELIDIAKANLKNFDTRRMAQYNQ